MAQYQSFPDAVGDSLTLEKARALRLPGMAGKSFLDVGCNEGFFCGLAKFLGAERAVGIDHSRLFVDRARRRFPDCEFHCASWDEIPGGSYDVILLASALHYADDQAALIERLVAHLAPGGVLVLELGIFSSGKSEWVKVERGIDERYFPTMPKLRDVLAGYAWKWMGPSVSQEGDPVGRHVVHVGRRLPVAYLLMHPPAYGKSSIAAHLFGPTTIQVVSGDQQLHQLAMGKLKASPRLSELVRRDYSPFRLDQIIQKLFDEGLGEELLDFWTDGLAGGEIALDAYVPAAYHEQVRNAFRDKGYLPITMKWERADLGMLPGPDTESMAEDFYLSMSEGGGGRDAPTTGARTLSGFVDEITVSVDRVIVRGWAVNESGNLPSDLAATLDGRPVGVDRMEKLQRNDVQQHLGLHHALVGFRLTLDVSDRELESRRGLLRIFAGTASSDSLPLGRNVDECWARAK